MWGFVFIIISPWIYPRTFQHSAECWNVRYLEALEKTGSHVDILGVYAQFLEMNGDLAAALEQWKKANEQYPSETYEKEINRLEAMIQ